MNNKQLQAACKIFLRSIGENPDRPGLRRTPLRWAKACDEWFGGYGQDPAKILRCFKDGAENVNEMVLLTNIPIASHCEHHIAPFTGVAHIGYLPNRRIVGLSKLPRLVDVFARRLQVQERLTVQIVDAIQEHLDPLGVGVMIRCEHTCMCSRGIRRPGILTTTTALRGVFINNPSCKEEFLGSCRSA
jgi:GTP cyclohydrolase I